jgi:hypothetical protein
MPLAKELAAELRIFADRLDTNPEVPISTGMLCFYHWSKEEKDNFLNVARLLPRPAKKRISGSAERPEIEIDYDSSPLRICASISQAFTCELIEPAKPAVYRCEPILSPDEDAALEA